MCDFGLAEYEHRDEPLRLVVVKGFGEKPMFLLTDIAGTDSRKSLWQVVKGYMMRWRVEDAIRFIKQSYRLEYIRLLDYTRLKNMIAVVLAAAFFAAVWLGESVRRGILVRNITRVSKRLFGVPDFHYYALADGIARLFSRCGRWGRERNRRNAAGTAPVRFRLKNGDSRVTLPALFSPRQSRF